MVFSANPLALSVPEPAFESWLREKGYLEILDQRTSDLHRLSTSSSSSTSLSSSSPSSSSSSSSTITTSTSDHRCNSTFDAGTSLTGAIFVSAFAYIGTLLSLFVLNPFSKLTSDDFSVQTPSWTHGFFGSYDAYSFPSSPSQARLRVHENVKRYARNYFSLLILFFVCSLYQMPLALVGLTASLALWDAFKFCGDQWGLAQYPVLRQILVRIAQCATAIVLFCSSVQMALLCAIGVCYAVMLLHASFRKLTPMNQASHGRRK